MAPSPLLGFLGISQQGILIYSEFHGPCINCTSNNNIVINVFNNLDQPFLLLWNDIQHRENSWQDGMPGTNCPIQPGQNFTYHWQPKGQIGSYFYFPSLGMHKATGGFSPISVYSRLHIHIPFDPPVDDYTVLIGDWYNRNFNVIKKLLDQGCSLSRPIRIVINGKSGKDNTGEDDPPMYQMEADKTYRYRVYNVGLKASLNFRIQAHKMKLVEIDGSHTVQNVYDSIDIHTGQCYSPLVTADQAPIDYYMVASTRFQKIVLTSTVVIRYTGSIISPSSILPPAPVS